MVQRTILQILLRFRPRTQVNLTMLMSRSENNMLRSMKWGCASIVIPHNIHSNTSPVNRQHFKFGRYKRATIVKRIF